MASPQLQEITKSELFKLVTPGLLCVIVSITTWQFNKISDRLDRYDAYLSQALADKATSELRLRTLEALVPERAAAIERLKDRTGLLEFRVQDIESREARSSGGVRKMP